jgi:hypothetical protein
MPHDLHGRNSRHPQVVTEAVMCAHAVTVNDVLDGHVALDIESLDRIYLNAYVPILQTSAQDVKKPATKDR